MRCARCLVRDKTLMGSHRQVKVLKAHPILARGLVQCWFRYVSVARVITAVHSCEMNLF